jgi:hypothetical protein
MKPVLLPIRVVDSLASIVLGLLQDHHPPGPTTLDLVSFLHASEILPTFPAYPNYERPI